MTYDFSKVPKEMQDLLCWLTWHKFPQPDGKIKKVPDEFTRNNKTWATMPYMFMAQAKQKLYSPQSLSDGIGFAFKAKSAFAGIDIDDAILPDGGYNEPVRQIILPVLAQARRDGCYIEKSISGTGYHIYGYTNLKPFLFAASGSGKMVSENIEIYYADSYFTVSGNCLSGGWGCLDNAIRIAYEIIKGTPLLEQLPTETPQNAHIAAVNDRTEETIPPTDNPVKKQAKTAQNNVIPAGEYSDQDVLNLPGTTVAKVLNIMSKDRIKHGAEAFDALENGYPANVNRSEFDEKILGVLTYWLYRFGVSEIVRVFQASALWTDERIKKKSDHYVEQAAEKAFNNAEKFFPAADYLQLDNQEKAKLKRWIKRKERGEA